MKNKVLFAVLALTSIVLTPIAVNASFYEPEVNFHGVKAQPFYDRAVTGEPQYNSSKSYQFNYMNVGTTWDTVRGDDVTVAVIDSGINIYHEDFLKPEAKGKTINAANVEEYSILSPKSAYIHDRTGKGQYTSNVVKDIGILNALDDDTYDSDYDEYYSHGTCSAGCIGAAVNGVGTLGLSPNVNLLIIKVDFFFNSLDVAIRYAADQGADVINMSLGAYSETFTDGYGDQQTGSSSVASYLTSSINYAWNKGSVIVASAGNENQGGHKSYPACNENVIGVGALEKQNGTRRASFSNWNVTDSSGNILSNNNVDVTAPGYVWVPMVDDVNNSSHYGMTQGTSFSSPLTAAACALYKSKYPTVTNSDIVQRLFDTCDDIGTSGFDKTFGYGRVNVSSMLDDGDGTIRVDSVSVSPKTATLYVDGNGGSKTTTLTKTFTPANADEEYKYGLWISNDETVATVDEETGVVTAVGEGTTEITFITEYNKEDSATITVVDNNPHNVSGVTLDKTSANLAIGSGVQLTATVSPANASNKNVVWTSSNQSVADVSNTGYVTAKATGTTNITATTVDGSFTATCAVTVNNLSNDTYQKVTSLSELTIGSPVAIVADGANYALGSQNSNNRSAVAITKGSADGKQTITKASGMANLTLQEGKKSGTYSFFDNDNDGYLFAASSGSNYLRVESTLTDNSSFAVTIGSSTSLVAQGTNTRNQLKYNTSSTIFSCYSTGQGAVSLYQPMVVGPTVDVASVTLDKTNADVVIGQTLTLNATVLPNDASNKKLTWTSDNGTVATVSDGVVTAKSVGQATITATSNNGISASCVVNVLPINVTGISLNKTSEELFVGKTSQLTATVTPSNATNKGVTWTTSKDSVATVSSSGLVTAVAPGNATITARTSDGGFEATCNVTVVEKVITKLAITTNPSKVSYFVGDTFSTSGLVVKATWNDGTVETVTSLCSISNPDMSTAGTKTVTISYGGFETSYQITVTAIALTSIEVTSLPNKVKYNVGETFDTDGLVVSALYNNGNKVDVTSSCVVSSPDMSTIGSKTITVTYNGQQATFEILVSNPTTGQNYLINFKTVPTDSSVELTSSANILAQIQDGSDYVSSASGSKAYSGTKGVKLGSSKANGYLELNINTSNLSDSASKVIIHTAQYGTENEAVTVMINGANVTSGVTSSAGQTEVTFTNQTNITSIRVTSSKRVYISGIEFVCEHQLTDEEVASDYATEFVLQITCSGQGSVTFTSAKWDEMATKFASLSPSVKALLKNATVNQGGDVIEQCAARYDAIVSKYGADQYQDFMERSPVASSKNLLVNANDDTVLLSSVIVIVSTTLACYACLKFLKKKEQ